VDEGETVAVGAVEIRATHADHDASRGPFGVRAPSLGFVAEGAGRRVYFAGDTDLFDGMRELATPQLDVALMPVSGWGPRLPAGHLDAAAAAKALALIRPRVAIPIHWATFMPFHRRAPYRLDAGHAFAEHARTAAPEVDVRVLLPGEVWDLDGGAEPA
jgi:L-ascorbate metabolism protein UlaG (beta-lactamase superfamily)